MKKVRCNFTYGVFTRWDSFKGENADTAEERKKDYTTDFRNAVPKRGDVFFIDSKSVKDKVKRSIARSLQLPLGTHVTAVLPTSLFLERFWREFR